MLNSDPINVQAFPSGSPPVRAGRSRRAARRRRRGELQGDLEDPQVVVLRLRVRVAGQLDPHGVLAGVEQPAGDRDADPLGRLVVLRLDVAIQVVDPPAVDGDVAAELAVADLDGVVADRRPRGRPRRRRAPARPGRPGRRSARSPGRAPGPRAGAGRADGSRRPRRPGGAPTSSKTMPAAAAEHGQPRRAAARDRQRAGIRRGQGEGILRQGQERPLGEIEVDRRGRPARPATRRAPAVPRPAIPGPARGGGTARRPRPNAARSAAGRRHRRRRRRRRPGPRRRAGRRRPDGPRPGSGRSRGWRAARRSG